MVRQTKGQHWGATRQIPVAVLLDPTGTNIRACVPDVRWTALHEAQLEISRKHMLSDQRRDSGEITRFFERALREALGAYPDTLLLTEAQNLRAGWPAIGNNALVADHIAFGTKPQPITRYPGLRHVRVRTTDQDETPQEYSFNDKTESHYRGLWPLEGDRIFLSTADKPASARRAAKYTSKVAPFVNSRHVLKDANPRAMVWNARPVEVTVAAVDPQRDSPEAWAALAHELRWAASHHSNAITLPRPLHIAMKLGEYLLPIEMLEDVAARSDDDQDDNSDPI